MTVYLLRPRAYQACSHVSSFYFEVYAIAPTNVLSWQKSVVNIGHGRQPVGMVTNFKDLGTLRHLRDGPLLPFSPACNCLYDHPGLSHLFQRWEGAERVRQISWRLKFTKEQ